MSFNHMAAQGEPVAWLQRHRLGPISLSDKGTHASGDWSAPFPVYEESAPPAPGVTVRPLVAEAVIDRAAKAAREVFAGSCDHTHEAIGYMEQVLIAALSQSAQTGAG